MVVHETQQQALADYLRSLQLDTFLFYHIEEHSSNMKNDLFLSARDKVVGYVPQVRVDVILNAEEMTMLLKNITDPRCDFKGKGIYWVTNLEEFGKL